MPEPPVNALVSIIMPAYNAERFLPETLECVQRQTYTPAELLLVDDGSSDRTPELLREAEEKQSGNLRLRVFDVPHGGVSAARNFGIDQAQGDYIAFLDADDLWTEDFLSRAVAELERRQADVVFCKTQTFDSDSRHPINTFELKATPTDRHAFERQLYQDNFITVISAVVRKKALCQVGKFDTRLRYCEDYDLWLRLMTGGYKFFYLNAVLALYRQHVGSASTNRIGMIQATMNVRRRSAGWERLDRLLRLQIWMKHYRRLATEGLRQVLRLLLPFLRRR